MEDAKDSINLLRGRLKVRGERLKVLEERLKVLGERLKVLGERLKVLGERLKVVLHLLPLRERLSEEAIRKREQATSRTCV